MVSDRPKRKAITERMKIRCLLYRDIILCGGCGNRIYPHDKIEWDHVHAVCADGPHEYENLRPLHQHCHKGKSARDVALNAKAKRIAGTVRQRAERNVIAVRGSRDVPGFDACVRAEMAELKATERKGPKMKSRPFQKKPKGYQTRWPSRKFPGATP